MKNLKVFLLTVLMSIFVTTGAHAEGKIGFVDLSRLFDEYYKTKAYDKVLEGQQKDFEKTRNIQIETIRESQGKLGLLTDEKKSDLEQEIEKQKKGLMEFDRQKKADLTKERNEKIREILLEIEKVVSDFAEKEGYSIILNDRVLIYGTPSYDISETILKLLNANQPKAE